MGVKETKFLAAAESEAGFTLIETIVALAILSGVLIAFYAFLSTTLAAARRIELTSTSSDKRMNALELATMINPMEQPDGLLDLGSYVIQWSSQIVEPPRQSSRYPAGRGVFQVGLYAVSLSFPNDRNLAPVRVMRMGFHRDKAAEKFPGGPAN